MRKPVIAGLLALGLTAAAAAQSAAPPVPPPPNVKVGEMAPDFTLRYFDGAKVQEAKLSDYRGKKNVVLAFYLFAFTPG
jgi:cytochrome oxidase Cu insertion factor (SCO1/SenC/PrrC family)